MAPSVSHAASEPLAEYSLPAVTVTPTTTFPTIEQTSAVNVHILAPAQEEREHPRPQAGPLPKKRGEIGFMEGVHDAPQVEEEASSSSSTLPERHPADRDNLSALEAGAPSVESPPRSPSRAESTTESTNTTGKRSIISFLKRKRIPTICGWRVTTLAIFLVQLGLLGAMLAGWILTIKRMQKASSASNSNDAAGQGGTSPLSKTSAQIFVHVAFAVVALAELIFLERSLFRLRAERYAYVHPGEVLPTSSRSRAPQERETAIAFAPWNRPPLPTYAAALAQSGVGTGDVEDNIIAIPPPPAYGNTRGSTLLLSGFLSEALRAQRPRSNGSTQSRISQRSGQSTRHGDEEQDRPKSYMSTDSEWEARCDADRALVLEETLAQLEEGNVGGRRVSGGRPGAR